MHILVAVFPSFSCDNEYDYNKLFVISLCLGACLLLLLSFAIFADAVSLSNVLSLEDQVRFKQTFYDAMPFKDLETAGYSVLGLKRYMKAEVPPTQVCNATEKRSQYVILPW